MISIAMPAFAAERILALAPHACEMLFTMGAGAETVGAVSYCDYPEAAKTLPRVGAYNHINVEAAIALKPTMAIVLDELTPGVPKLKALGVKIVQSYPKTVEEVFSDVGRIGDIIGHQAEASRVESEMRARFARLKEKIQMRKIPVFYEIWSDPLLTAGHNTFIHDVLAQTGFDNVFGSIELEAPRVNVEAVLQAKPKLVIIPSEKRDIAERSTYWRKWLGNDIQVITVNPDLVHRPGPRLLDGMESLLAAYESLELSEKKEP